MTFDTTSETLREKVIITLHTTRCPGRGDFVGERFCPGGTLSASWCKGIGTLTVMTSGGKFYDDVIRLQHKGSYITSARWLGLGRLAD